ncbi:tetratricopeptide repeat protein [Leptobacterium flavescens]|uniref:Tetratricopeptide repeat protein n=1 Tax=Leptobacterium flavescens TaxID=472055 RepID=A0A6P0UL61_9FLAO|nr:alpha/beta hydrolase-fold protein [Leptobacterium flavescens]NER12619.1 tetratricopeptide repeat protein [Leptobacterium flavescens]
MKQRTFLLFILSLIIFSSTSIAQNSTDIVIGKKLTIKSEVLNSDREIRIYLPESYNYNNYTKYPVLYLLDGRKFFHPFTGAVAQLSSDASPQIPEMIVVGITSQDRVRDSSPTNSLIGYTGKEERGLEVSGGADNFLRFIREELIPYIDSNYKTNSYRMLAGYSFTGLPVLHSLFTHPENFNSYLVIDFSAWWDNEVSLKNASAFLKDYKGPKKDVFMATVDRVLNTVYTEKQNPGWTFIQEFERNRPEQIGFGYKKFGYKQENHHSMPLVSFIEGLKYIFRGYMINYDEMYTDPSRIKPKFEKLSERLGYDTFLSEGLVSFFGYQFLYAHPDIEKAIFYFNYNTENYPMSSSAWSNLARAYNVKGDKKKALEYYQKAVALNPKNTEAQKQLDILKK